MLTKQKIVHIHPTLLCNFTCLHCYSSSGPRKHRALEVDTLLNATGQLRNYGYHHASLSGGEPTLYPRLEELCRGLASQGYNVSVITNGWDVSRLLPLLADTTLDFAAVSFDGMGDLHDRIRRKKGAFENAGRGLEKMRAVSPTVGAVVSVTAPSMLELPDIVEYLANHRVAKVQLHPVAAVGRAREDHGLDVCELKPEALIRLLLMNDVFANTWPDIEFQTDAVLGSQLRGLTGYLADEVVSPLVIDELGRLVPLAHGVNPDFRLGNIGEPIARPLANPDLRRLIQDSLVACSNVTATCFFSEFVRRTLVCEPADNSDP